MDCRRQEISEKQRKLAIDVYIWGAKQCKLAELFSVDKSTISRLVKKYNDWESMKKSPNRDIILIWTVRKKRRQTPSEIMDNLDIHVPCKNISKNTQFQMNQQT